MITEVCVESFAEACEGQKRGVKRIELCENLAVGGTTPSYGTIKKCRNDLQIPFFVMIRPRGGDFVYTDDEFEIMREDILMCKELKVPGVVFGILEKDNTIDQERTMELVQLASPMQITFHKAIDETPDLIEAVEFLQDLGVNRILTSGGKATAMEGQENLRAMIAKADGSPTILVAGKVTNNNLDELRKLIPASEFHGRRIVDELNA